MLRRSAVWVLTLAFAWSSGLVLLAQDTFTPIKEGTPIGEQLPAGPFIVGSYAFFLLLMVFYLWTIWRRINRVEKDLQDLARRQKDATR